ncbi:hypothetical protein, unlikely [Trypanosoma brucei gambiense DAL972]|uniref:Uncharacterized protein n=1 Tax=Trypanosoma brucei gambiense (strain MHOM/CI/86/DAL972) TaxID=679716 RepID=C9ZNN1_TRYB9|nr:hypothetical protein, unlikely [Trypanosoma brucei gambiense DAL972]CBH11009.1 hypothetical protein, unlikely [Trypanosoma brucei gambiense DAL972]|eukprot:XP_011773296.1 hypothetical protein, unlikely [Trypanosoma brucei gambiense DAL972]
MRNKTKQRGGGKEGHKNNKTAGERTSNIKTHKHKKKHTSNQRLSETKALQVKLSECSTKQNKEIERSCKVVKHTSADQIGKVTNRSERAVHLGRGGRKENGSEGGKEETFISHRAGKASRASM